MKCVLRPISIFTEGCDTCMLSTWPIKTLTCVSAEPIWEKAIAGQNCSTSSKQICGILFKGDSFLLLKAKKYKIKNVKKSSNYLAGSWGCSYKFLLQFVLITARIASKLL